MARKIFPVVFPITVETFEYAKEILDKHRGLMARDAIHASVVELYSLDAICPFDSDFDIIKTIRRVKPA